MKNFNFKKVGLPIALAIVIAFSSVIAVWSMKKTDNVKESADTTVKTTVAEDGSFRYEESTKPTEESVTEVSVETTILENGEVETHLVNVVVGDKNKETEKSKDETTKTSTNVNKETTRTQSNSNDEPTRSQTTQSVNTQNVVTTTKQETTTKKPVATTKAPTTTKKPTTTKAPKNEYYPALTKADVEEIKQYTINYIKSKGQPVEPSLDWDWAGYSTFNSVPYDLSIRGDMFKIDGGTDPVEWVKGRMRDTIDFHIKDWERENGKGTIGGLYPLVRTDGEYWDFTVGYC